jgi:hypothetical protein
MTFRKKLEQTAIDRLGRGLVVSAVDSDGVIEARLFDIGDNDAHARLRGFLSQGATDPAPRAGDDCDLSGFDFHEFLLVLIEFENAQCIFAQELRPDVVVERNVRHIGELTLE